MIYIRIELWPRGNRAQASLLGEGVIANDGTGTVTRGNYHGHVKRTTAQSTRAGAVKNFPRKRLSVWYLLARLLKDVGIQ